MKKVYAKPEIVFENFSLSTNIAANCEIPVRTFNAGGCGYAYEGGNGETMFTAQAGTNVCNIPVNDDESNGYCYHTPVEGNNMFNS